MSACRVREPRADDRPALVDALSSDDTFRADEIEVALELIDSVLENKDDYQILVAELEGPSDTTPRSPKVCGYICYGRTPMTQSTYDLYWLVTHAQARGRGVAGSLVTEMERRLLAAGAYSIRVETSELESYGAARRFYAKHGYPEASRLHNFYRPGDHLVTYYKEL